MVFARLVDDGFRCFGFFWFCRGFLWFCATSKCSRPRFRDSGLRLRPGKPRLDCPSGWLRGGWAMIQPGQGWPRRGLNPWPFKRTIAPENKNNQKYVLLYNPRSLGLGGSGITGFVDVGIWQFQDFLASEKYNAVEGCPEKA